MENNNRVLVDFLEKLWTKNPKLTNDGSFIKNVLFSIIMIILTYYGFYLSSFELVSVFFIFSACVSIIIQLFFIIVSFILSYSLVNFSGNSYEKNLEIRKKFDSIFLSYDMLFSSLLSTKRVIYMLLLAIYIGIFYSAGYELISIILIISKFFVEFVLNYVSKAVFIRIHEIMNNRFVY